MPGLIPTPLKWAAHTDPESTPSNTVRFLTDIAIDAYSHGPNQIKIEWDDVWYSGRRMEYKLYISENSEFVNTPPIYIRQEHIGPSGPVTVNEAAGKLSTYTPYGIPEEYIT